MQSLRSKQLFEEASGLLDSISLETNRPSEDSVNYLVCQKARISLGKLLSSFILANGGDAGSDDTNLGLFNKCTELAPEFKSVPLYTLNCNRTSYDDQSVYCLSHDKTTNCLQVATQVRDLVRRSLTK